MRIRAHHSEHRKFASARGFTLVESLVITAIIAVLASLGLSGMKACVEAGRKTREMTAAKTLVTAYHAATLDNNGRFLPGMDLGVNVATNPIYKPNGAKLTNSRAGQRYPFRLVPYLGKQFDGAILVNDNGAQIKAMGGSESMQDYYLSAYPALGINAFCVGGIKMANGQTLFESDCVNTPGRMRGNLLVFASAGVGTGASKVDGYNYVAPPTLSFDSPLATSWSDAPWKENVDPAKYGFIDARFKGGKAVCAFLDGSVRLHGVEELRDMRIWNVNAAEQGDPGYIMKP